MSKRKVNYSIVGPSSSLPYPNLVIRDVGPCESRTAPTAAGGTRSAYTEATGETYQL